MKLRNLAFKRLRGSLALLWLTCLWLWGCETTETARTNDSAADASSSLSEGAPGKIPFGTSTDAASTGGQDDTSSSATLTLGEVQAIARRHNPTFQEFAANLEAARAEILAAQSYPNPEVELFAGGARSRGTSKEQKAEYAIGLMQPLEMPGKREARRAAAAAGVTVVERKEETFRTTLRAEVAKAYYLVCFQRRALGLAMETATMAGELEAIVQKRVEGGETAQVDLIKGRIVTLKARRQAQAERRKLTAARIALNTLCGGVLAPNFEPGEDFAASLPTVQSEAARTQALANHPALRHLDAQLAQQRAVIARERTAWHPDPKPGISVGRQIDSDSFDVSLGLEIPLWNRNQGGIAGAQAELNRLKAERERRRSEIESSLRASLEMDANAREQLGAFDTALRQGAAEALKIETFLYQQGEHDLLQLLDARRTARETESEYLQALYDAAIARVELEQAIGIGGEDQ